MIGIDSFLSGQHSANESMSTVGVGRGKNEQRRRRPQQRAQTEKKTSCIRNMFQDFSRKDHIKPRVTEPSVSYKLLNASYGEISISVPLEQSDTFRGLVNSVAFSSDGGYDGMEQRSIGELLFGEQLVRTSHMQDPPSLAQLDDARGPIT